VVRALEKDGFGVVGAKAVFLILKQGGRPG
jgi:hypothetical protein